MFLSEKYKIVPVFAGYDLSTHDTVMTSDSINMKGFHHCTYIITFDDIGTASPVLYVYSGATAAALTSALTFYYAFGGAITGTAVAGSTASADVQAAWATSAALTITHGTYDTYQLIVEVPAASMDLANNENWLHLNFCDPTTGCTGQVTATALLEPRYIGNRSLTALV
jgi:hypothetical protein